MSFDWRPESKDRYFRKAEAAVKAAGGSYKKIGSFVDSMVKDRDPIPEILKKWYPDMDFTNANVYYNDFNCMFYIHARMRKRRIQSEKTEKTGKTCRTT